MPVLRSRNANVRFEAGRGYPRFNKWSDINKSTIIADDVHLEKREFELLSHAPNFSRCELRAESKKHSSSSEWNLRRHGVLIQSDGESDEASSDNSLICSNFKVIPDNGKVRMALTVPLTRLAAPETRNRSVLQSTLQIKHTTRRIAKDGRNSNEQRLYSCVGNAERNFSRQKKRNSDTKGHYRPIDDRIITNNSFNEMEVKKKQFHNEEAISSPPFGFRDSHIFICENKESLRPLSFWHDMRACRKGCVASQKNRLRDGTFIISPADSEMNLVRKKRGLKMLPRNSLFPNESEEIEFPANRSMKGVFPLRLDLNDTSIPSAYDDYQRRKRDGCLKSLSRKPPLEVRFHYQGMRHYPITFTSASHTGLRCYPPLECHPSPKCRQSFPKPFELPNLNRCRQFPVDSILPTNRDLILKKKPFDAFGLTIRNRYAVMDSDSDENEQCSRFPIQKPYSRVMSEYSMGQKASSGDGSTKLPKRQTNNQQSNSPASSSATSTIETPTHAPICPETGNASQGKGKKVLKTSVKETSTKKTFHLKAKCSSNSIPHNSPASLHGRVLQKTSTVSPAPSKTTDVNSQQSLPRFGFKNSSIINSGDSTDSVNSILSDAQTTSDANSNFFEFGEENGNASTERADKLTPTWKSEGTPIHNVRSASPCNISQASSGVTSSLLNGKLKAHTRQLPSPQTVTVKEMNNNKKKQISPNGSYKLRNASPLIKKTQTPQSSPAVTSKDQRSKIPQNIKASLSKTQKASKEIESSNRSISTIDSGLGSSLESDKLRSPKILSPSEKDKLIDTGQGIVNNVEDINLDLSDEWLKEKRTHLSLGSSVIGDSKVINGTVTQKPVKIQKDTFKDKRDSSITYGMARQKFAPYSRYRYNYQNNIKTQNQTEKNVSKADILSQSKSNLPGVVRSRIAQLEKTPSKTPTNLSSHKTPKKSITKPTSIEKTPILVNSKIENNIELSRSICKRLEYNEGKKSSLLENMCDNKLERKDEVPTIIRDLLMVDSVEVKKKSLDSDESQTSPSKVIVNISDNKIKISNSEQKRIRDIVECENTIKRLSDESKLNTDVVLHLPLPDNSAKIFSPDGSETSFEVLESGSVDCSPREEAALSASNEAYLNYLVAGIAKSSSDSVSFSKPFQNLPENASLTKDEEYCRNEEPTPSPEDCASQADACTIINEERSDNFDGRSKSVMESSVESSRSESNRTTDNNGDRWTVSGKCTPSIGSTRGDADQDFLIDDEISDQPGLTFGDDLDASLFGDEDLFSDLSSASATNILSKKERSRHGSIGTTASSLGPDDLMLDYDIEESKPYGPKQRLKSSDKSPTTTTKSKNSSQQCKKKVEISLPGPRYDEEVLSPVACDILSEWSAILSGTPHSPIRSSPEPCVSHQTAVVSTVCSSALSSSSSQTQTTNVTTQPLREENSFGPEGCSSSRSRAFSVGADVPQIEIKKGLNLKPPRQGLSSEHDGGLNIDRTTLHYLCQDVTAMKTLLLRLRRVLQVTDTINPFDANLKTSLYLNLGVNDASEKDEPTSVQDVVQQNVDLKRQVVLLQQRLDEKDRTIRSLQQQLVQPMQKSSSSSVVTPTNSTSCLVSSNLSFGDDDFSNCSSSEKSLSNAATQTERNNHRSSSYALASMSRTSSVEDGFGPTVSFENLAAERSLSENSVILNENSVGQKEEKEEEEKEEVVEFLSPHKNYPPEIIPVGSPKLSLVSTTTHVTEPLAPS